MKARWLVPAAVVFLVWLICAWALPIVQDEAYYFSWADHPGLGYFDHPPFVAWMTQSVRWADGSPLIARAGTLAVGALTLWAGARFFTAVGLSGKRALMAAMLLAFGNLAGLVFGFLATPDTAQMFAWTLALAEAALALSGRPQRWVTAGLATGLGLWAKYTMLLMGPVFLWALVVERRQLKTAWPYLGGVACIFVLLPHLWWNAQHDWVTLRFQIHHGLAKEHIALGDASVLPLPEKALKGSVEFKLASPFAELQDLEKKEEKEPAPYDQAMKSLNRYFGYYASQVGLWGMTAVALFLAWRGGRRRRRGLAPAAPDSDGCVSPATRTLVVAATAVPLIVFGLVSLFSQVEPNWSAMYMIGASALLTPWMVGSPKRLWIATAANAALVLLLLAHAVTGVFPTRPHRDRILAETHGFKAMAHTLTELDGPVFADSYQLTAMARYFEPHLDVHQWPGITRDSEFVRQLAGRPDLGDELRTGGRFWLVTTALPPPHFLGFSAGSMAQLRDCKGEALQVISSQAAGIDRVRCKKPIHEWYLVRYDGAV